MTEVLEISKTCIIPMTPMPTPRSRARIVKPKGRPQFISFYNPPEYMEWKEELARVIGKINIDKKNWNTLNAIFYIPVPRSYSLKKRMAMHGTLHEQKPDSDNYTKGLLDALQLREDRRGYSVLYRPPIGDDGCVSSSIVRKIWINDPTGKIVFNLARIRINPLALMIS